MKGFQRPCRTGKRNTQTVPEPPEHQFWTLRGPNRITTPTPYRTSNKPYLQKKFATKPPHQTISSLPLIRSPQPHVCDEAHLRDPCTPRHSVKHAGVLEKWELQPPPCPAYHRAERPRRDETRTRSHGCLAGYGCMGNPASWPNHHEQGGLPRGPRP